MFSLGSHLALHSSSMMHSFVDSFFLSKKALVKDRLRQSMETIVDGLFEEMVEQVKEMLLPPKECASNGKMKPSCFESTTTTTDATSAKTEASSLLVTENLKNKMIFATKSKPGPSSSSAAPQPFSGFYKRMAEEDGNGNNSQPNKKKAITVELQNDDPFNDADNQGWADSSADDYVSSVSSFVVDWQGQGGEGSMQGKGKTGQQQDQQKATEQQDQQQATEQQEQQQNYPRTATSASGSEVKSGKSAAVGILSKSPCPTCKVLVTKKNLPRHLKTHTGGKFACPTTGCTKEYTRFC